VPDGTRSFALIVEDADVSGGPFRHRVADNIPEDIVASPKAGAAPPRLPVRIAINAAPWIHLGENGAVRNTDRTWRAPIASLFGGLMSMPNRLPSDSGSQIIPATEHTCPLTHELGAAGARSWKAHPNAAWRCLLSQILAHLSGATCLPEKARQHINDRENLSISAWPQSNTTMNTKHFIRKKSMR
jgi:hypothetical protein